MAAEFWVGLFGGAALGGIVAELLDVSAWFAPRIIRRAAAKMPTTELRERYEEEWLAELSTVEGLKLVKLAVAIGIWVNGHKTASALQPGISITLRDVVRLTFRLWRRRRGFAHGAPRFMYIQAMLLVSEGLADIAGMPRRHEQFISTDDSFNHFELVCRYPHKGSFWYRLLYRRLVQSMITIIWTAIVSKEMKSKRKLIRHLAYAWQTARLGKGQAHRVKLEVTVTGPVERGRRVARTRPVWPPCGPRITAATPPVFPSGEKRSPGA